MSALSRLDVVDEKSPLRSKWPKKAKEKRTLVLTLLTTATTAPVEVDSIDQILKGRNAVTTVSRRKQPTCIEDRESGERPF